MTATTSVAPHIQLLVVVALATLLQLLGVRAEVISCPTIPLTVSECRHGALTPSLYLAQYESCYFSAPVGSTKVVGYTSITLHGHNTIYIVGRVSITVGEIKRCSSFCSSNTDRLTFVGTGFGGARRSSTSDATCHGGATGGGSSVGNGGGTSSVLSASSTPVELAWWQDLLSVIGNAGSVGMGGCEAATNVAVSNAGKGGARLQLIVNDDITAKRLDFHFDGCTVPADGTAALAGAQAIGGGGGGWVRLNMVALAATTQVYISARGSDGWRSDAAAASGSVAGGGSGGFVGLVLAASAASRVASPFLASEDNTGLSVHYNITGGRTVGGGGDGGDVVEGSSGVAAVMFWSLTSQTVQLDLGPAANATNPFATSNARSVTNTTFAPQRDVYLAAPKLGVAGNPTLSVMVGDPMGVRIRPCTYEDRAGCLAAALANPRLQDVHVYDGGVVALDDVTDTPLALSGALQLRSGGILVLGPQVELHAAEVSAVDPGSLILLQGNSTLRRVGGGNGGISVSSGAVLACGGLSSSGQDAPCTVSDMLLAKAALAVVGLSASLVVEDTLQAANTSTAIVMWPRARLQAQTMLLTTGSVVVSPQLATYGLVATIPMREREYWACAGHPQCANATQWEEHFTVQAPLLRTNVLTAMLAMPGIMLLIGRHGTAAIEGRITAFATPQPHTMRAPLLCTSGPLGGTHSGVGGGGVSSDACASWGATHRNRLAPAQWGQQLAATSPLQGAGGGFVRIHGYTLTIDGQVSVRGGTGHGPASCDAIPALRGAGGAGGTIQILAHTLTGRGSLDASGGAAGHSCNTESAGAVGDGAGGGGGGALQVYMEAAVEPRCPGNLTCTAVGGAGTSSELDGGGGEIVVKTTLVDGVFTNVTFTLDGPLWNADLAPEAAMRASILPPNHLLRPSVNRPVDWVRLAGQPMLIPTRATLRTKVLECVQAPSGTAVAPGACTQCRILLAPQASVQADRVVCVPALGAPGAPAAATAIAVDAGLLTNSNALGGSSSLLQVAADGALTPVTLGLELVSKPPHAAPRGGAGDAAVVWRAVFSDGKACSECRATICTASFEPSVQHTCGSGGAAGSAVSMEPATGMLTITYAELKPGSQVTVSVQVTDGALGMVASQSTTWEVDTIPPPLQLELVTPLPSVTRATVVSIHLAAFYGSRATPCVACTFTACKASWQPSSSSCATDAALGRSSAMVATTGEAIITYTAVPVGSVSVVVTVSDPSQRNSESKRMAWVVAQPGVVVLSTPTFGTAAIAGTTTPIVAGPRLTVPLTVSLPQAPASGETVFVACTSTNTANGGAIAPTGTSFDGHSASLEHVLTVSGVDDGANTDTPAVPFSVSCTVTSSMSAGRSTSTRHYPAAGTPVEPAFVTLVNHNLVIPAASDVLVESRTSATAVSALGGVPRTMFLASSGSSRVTLVAKPRTPGVRAGPQYLPQWSAGANASSTAAAVPEITVGGVPCTNVSVSSDGLQVTFVTPPFSALCPSIEACQGDAGYKPLAVLGAGGAAASVRASTISSGRQHSVHMDRPYFVAPWNCPSDCPGEAQARGVYYTPVCTGYLLGLECFDTAKASQCAFGHGDSCRPCPAGGLCPGGTRVWSQVGYYVHLETAGVVVQCDAPAKTRCVGWDATAGRTRCGSGYSSATSACRGCAPSFYDAGGGKCKACPEASFTQGVLLPAGLLGATLATLFALVVGVGAALLLRRVRMEERVYGAQGISVQPAGADAGPGMLPRVTRFDILRAAVVRATEFTIWTAVTLQALVQVGKGATQLPEYMTRMYEVLSVFELQMPFVPLDCYQGSSPFTFQVVQLLVVFGLAFLFVALGVKCCKSCSLKARLGVSRVRNQAMVLLIVLYPLTCDTAMSLVHCRRLDDGSGTSNRWVVAAHPDVGCWEGPHVFAGAVGVAACVFVVLLPITTAIYLSRHLLPAVRTMHQQAKELRRAPQRPTTTQPNMTRLVTWGRYINASYKPHRFYFKQIDMVVLFILGGTLTFLRATPWLALAINMLALCGQAVLLAVVRPHAAGYSWELPVKLFAIAVAATGAMLGAVSTATAADPGSSAASATAVQALSAATFAATAGLLLVLVVSCAVGTSRASLRKAWLRHRRRMVAKKAVSAMGVFKVNNPMKRVAASASASAAAKRRQGNGGSKAASTSSKATVNAPAWQRPTKTSFGLVAAAPERTGRGGDHSGGRAVSIEMRTAAAAAAAGSTRRGRGLLKRSGSINGAALTSMPQGDKHGVTNRDLEALDREDEGDGSSSVYSRQHDDGHERTSSPWRRNPMRPNTHSRLTR